METGRGAAAPLDSPPAAYIQKAKKEKRVVFPLSFLVDLWYNGHVVNFPNSLFHTEGGEFPLSELEILVSFVVSVAAGIATHYICKWLDRHK